RVGELAILTSTEVERIDEWNHIARRYPRDATVAAYISRRAVERPDCDAVIGEKSRVDFRTLDGRSNQLARRLRQEGVTRESIVAIAAERSPNVIIAMLAVWKAGGAYVSLDPSYPQDRVRYMLADAGASLILTERRVAGRAPWLARSETLWLDDASSYDESNAALEFAHHPQDLAYVVYTSGSTGTPKGVAVSHGALVMHSLAAGEIYGMSPDDAALHFASMSFDAAIEQWVVPLMHGARLLLSGDEPWTAQRTAAALERERVTVIYPPTNFLLRLAEWIEERGAPHLPRVCCVGGEAVSRETYDQIRRVLRPEKVINGYGPTETVITPLLWNAGSDTPCDTAYAPIGRAVGERTSYIVDADMNLAPLGAVGELVIGGEGLARGYFGRPDWTAERFVPNPFDGQGGRLYRTGDLVRYRDGGVIEYVGRADGQVKLRGYRIELGEIEAELLQNGPVREAVVVLREENDRKRLVAYVAAREGASIRPDDLREALTTRLPDHMVPAKIVVLGALPRTPNGKIDRAALPMIEASHRVYVEPVSALEKTLALIWQEVLGVEQVGAIDHFFELGGDSIVSIQLVSRARLAGLRISPKDVFQHPTLRALATVARPLAEKSRKQELAIPRGDVPLLPIQSTFFERVRRDRHWWNQSLLLEPRERLEIAPLRRAVSVLIEHHDSLRLRYAEQGGAWKQSYADFDREVATRALEHVENIALADIERIARDAQQSLDLAEGPALRAVLMSLRDGTQRLLLVVHHLVVDGVSSRILIEDLDRAYRRALAGLSPDLPAKTTSFQTWATHLETLVRSDELTAEIPFWEEMLPRCDDLPRDGAADGATRKDAISVSVVLDPDRTTKLLRDAPAAYRTQINDLLLAALARALSRWTGGPTVHLELEGHGREEVADDLDLSRTVGWFTTAFPVGLPVVPDLGDNIIAVKEQLRRVPRRGLGFGVLEHQVSAARVRFAELSRPRVTFNYLGQFDTTFDERTLFRPARESAGDDRSPHAPLGNWIEINGQTFEGRLSLEWTFASTMFRREIVQQVADHCREELERLIEHCASGANGGVSPSDFPLAGLSLEAMRRLPISPRAIEDVYPLTPLQQGMLFHVLAEPNTSLYVTQLDVVVDDCDPVRLLAAWRRAIADHAILRTAFVWKGLPHPVQVVQKDVAFDFDVREAHGQEPAREVEALRHSERTREFRFDEPPLQRVVLLHLGDTRYRLIWTSHHLLLDGWSSARLLSEIVENYEQSTERAPRRALVGKYRDYLAWIASRDA
ncbi:MAG: amino acid adenylation domain-containing protein, partial [Polyangiaceae bacterium]